MRTRREMICARTASPDSRVPRPRPPSRSLPFGLRAPVCLILLTLASCATTDIKPLTEPGSRYGVDKDERSLIRKSDELERKLHKKGLVLEDAELQQYLDSVGAKLVPPQASEHIRFRFLVLRDPTINAYAMIQGAVCIHSGMLARLENEAQLAHVLAHEITHTLKRHQLKALRSGKNKTVKAKVAELALVPAAAVYGGGTGASLTSALIGLTHAATVTGYSRDLEEEADKDALMTIAAAGYDIQEAPQLFAALNEIEDPGALETFFYSDHPSNRARAEYTRKLLDSGAIAQSPDGVTQTEKYQRVTRKVALRNIRLRLKAGHYRYALQEAEALIRKRDADAWLHYLAGEAHRRLAEDPEGAAREDAMRRREKPDESLVERFKSRADKELEAASAEFNRALDLDPSFKRAHRGLGLVAHQRGEAIEARRELQAYLRGDTRIRDRRYIESILEELER